MSDAHALMLTLWAVTVTLGAGIMVLGFRIGALLGRIERLERRLFEATRPPTFDEFTGRKARPLSVVRREQ